MSDKTYQQYVTDAKDAEDLRRLRALPEFRAMDRLLKNIYRHSAEKIISTKDLLTQDMMEEKAKISFITELFDSMEYDLKLGQDASEYLAQQKLNQLPSTNTD